MSAERLVEIDPQRRVALYLRVSSKSQVDTDFDPEGLSIPAQRAICKRKADALGLTIVDEYVEAGRSGTNVQGRPEYQAMMKRVSEKRDIDFVMVYQLSRLNRNRVDDAMVMVEMQAAGVELISATENIDETPAGQLTRGILAAINQYRSVSEGEDIARKLAHKARLGGTVGPAPLGYRNVKEDFEGRMVSAIALDEERAPLIRKGFELYATGEYSLKRLAETMADLGLTTRTTRRHPNARTVSVNKWHQMLSNPYYMGMLPFKDEIYKGRHEGIVSPALFAAVQAIMEERSAPTRRDRSHFHYLKKQLYCDRCAKAGRTSKLVFTVAKGSYEYFVCMARQRGECDLPHLPALLVEDYVVRHYETIDLPEDFVAVVTKAVTDAITDEQSSLRELHASLEKRLREIDAQEERLIDLAVEGLPQHRIRERMNKLRADRARIEADQKQTGATLAVGAEVLQDAMQFIQDVAALYRSARDEARGHLNDAFFSRLYIDEDGIHGDELEEPMKEILEAARPTRTHAVARGQKRVSAPSRASHATGPARGADHRSLTDLLALLGVTPLGVRVRPSWRR